MDGDLERQVPALIAVFELAGTAVTLQRGAKVIRPDRHPEFPGKIVEEFGGGGAPAMRPRRHRSLSSSSFAASPVVQDGLWHATIRLFICERQAQRGPLTRRLGREPGQQVPRLVRPYSRSAVRKIVDAGQTARAVFCAIISPGSSDP